MAVHTLSPLVEFLFRLDVFPETQPFLLKESSLLLKTLSFFPKRVALFL
jgi:hypothetical protein